MKITITFSDSAILSDRKEDYSLFESAEQGLAKLENLYLRASEQARFDHDCNTPQGQSCAICAELDPREPESYTNEEDGVTYGEHYNQLKDE